jgi:hypothetical protein
MTLAICGGRVEEARGHAPAIVKIFHDGSDGAQHIPTEIGGTAESRSVYVEPVWTIEWAVDFYKYSMTRCN